MPSLKMTPSRKARTSVHAINAANAPIKRPATGGMLHLTLDEHACGEGLNKGWQRAGDIAAAQVLELTAGFRFLKISRLSIVRQSEGARWIALRTATSSRRGSAQTRAACRSAARRRGCCA